MEQEKYHIVVCDDEETILKDMGRVIEEEFLKRDVGIQSVFLPDARQLLEYLKRERVDVLFLDIDMPYINGMEIASFIQERNLPVLLIFVTSQDTLVYQTFRYQPFGFIRKSVFRDEIGEVAERVVTKLERIQDAIVWQQSGESVIVKLKDIIYLESDLNYVNVITEDKTYRFRDTLTNLEGRLEPKGFIRIHKGFMVNGDKVHILKADRIQMEDGTFLPVGRSYGEAVKKKLMLLFRRYR